jgi:hypothetical protein
VPDFQQRLPQSRLAHLSGTDDKGHATLAKVILQEQVFEAPLHTTNFQYPGRKSRPMTRWPEESHVAGDIALPRNFEGCLPGVPSRAQAMRSSMAIVYPLRQNPPTAVAHTIASWTRRSGLRLRHSSLVPLGRQPIEVIDFAAHVSGYLAIRLPGSQNRNAAMRQREAPVELKTAFSI